MLKNAVEQLHMLRLQTEFTFATPFYTVFHAILAEYRSEPPTKSSCGLAHGGHGLIMSCVRRSNRHLCSQQEPIDLCVPAWKAKAGVKGCW